MNTIELNKFLRDRAKELNLCNKWYKEWNLNGDRQYLIDLYLNGYDFTIYNDWPKVSFIKENFDKELLRKNGILADDNYCFANKKIVMLLGNSTSEVRNSGWNVGTCFVRHSSKATITAKNMTFTTVHVYDNAEVEIEVKDKANVVVITYSDNVKVTAPKSVKVKRNTTFFDQS